MVQTLSTDVSMLVRNNLDEIIKEIARQQSHELNAADNLEIRCRVAGTLAAKERHRQRPGDNPSSWRCWWPCNLRISRFCGKRITRNTGGAISGNKMGLFAGGVKLFFAVSIPRRTFLCCCGYLYSGSFMCSLILANKKYGRVMLLRIIL